MSFKALNHLLQDLQSEHAQTQKELEALRLFKAGGESLSFDADLTSSLANLLSVSMNITQADFGNMQLLDARTGTLKIVAHEGFGRPFLEFFNTVHSGQATCGTAMQLRQGVFVPDVTASPIFRDNETLEVMLAAESRSVRSFPLIASSGRLVGVLSSLYRKNTPCTRSQIFITKVLATKLANFIEQRHFARLRRVWSFPANLR